MDKEYIVLASTADELEDKLNSCASQGYEFCGMFTDSIRSCVVMRKKPEMDNSDVDEDLYSGPSETPEQKNDRLLRALDF